MTPCELKQYRHTPAGHVEKLARQFCVTTKYFEEKGNRDRFRKKGARRVKDRLWHNVVKFDTRYRARHHACPFCGATRRAGYFDACPECSWVHPFQDSLHGLFKQLESQLQKHDARLYWRYEGFNLSLKVEITSPTVVYDFNGRETGKTKYRFPAEHLVDIRDLRAMRGPLKVYLSNQVLELFKQANDRKAETISPEGESMHAFGVEIPMAGRLKKFPWA